MEYIINHNLHYDDIFKDLHKIFIHQVVEIQLNDGTKNLGYVKVDKYSDPKWLTPSNKYGYGISEMQSISNDISKEEILLFRIEHGI